MQPMARNTLIGVAVGLVLVLSVSWKTSSHSTYISHRPRVLAVQGEDTDLSDSIEDEDENFFNEWKIEAPPPDDDYSSEVTQKHTSSHQTKVDPEEYEKRIEEIWGSSEEDENSEVAPLGARLSTEPLDKHLDTGVKLTKQQLAERREYENAEEQPYQGTDNKAANENTKNSLKKHSIRKSTKHKGKNKTTSIPTTISTSTSTTSMSEQTTASTTAGYTTEFPGPSYNTSGTVLRDVVHFEMDYEVNSNLDEIFQKRINKVRSMCEADKTLEWDHTQSKSTIMRQRENDDSRVHTYTSHNAKQSVQLCIIPKAGSAFWDYVFAYIETGDRMDRKAAKTLSINDWMNSKIYGTDAPSITTVRNPWKRLVSLFQQKIEEEWKKPKSPYHRYMSIVCHIDRNNSPEKLSTFRHLIDCVLRLLKERRIVNRHWANVYSRCAVCSSNIKYIIRTENMMPEGAHVLEKAGFKNGTAILNHVRELTIRDVEKKVRPAHSQYYTDIPDNLILELAAFWKPDIEMFGYPNTPFTD